MRLMDSIFFLRRSEFVNELSCAAVAPAESVRQRKQALIFAGIAQTDLPLEHKDFHLVAMLSQLCENNVSVFYWTAPEDGRGQVSKEAGAYFRFHSL
jgi:hypothetical protein